jgi:hypothetical protein
MFSSSQTIKKVNVVIVLLVLILLLFPVSKTQEITYVGNGGSAGTIEKQRLVPWWFPEFFLKKSVPLKNATKDEVKKLIDQAYRQKDIDKLKVIQRSYPEVQDLVSELENNNGTGKTNGSATTPTADSNEGESTVPPSSGAGGTLEARIPAYIEGFEFVTESRSLLSWLGVFKSKGDLNIQSLEVSIELLGQREARNEVENFVSANKKVVQKVSVKGIDAYFVPISAYEARLIFNDGDFLYEFKLILGGGAYNYKEKLRQIAEKAHL